MKIEIGKEYVQAGFPKTKVKVLGPVSGRSDLFWCECKTDVVWTEQYYSDGKIKFYASGGVEKFQLVEKPRKRTFWCNVWENGSGTLFLGTQHDTKEECILSSNYFPPKERAVGRKKITLVEGEFDE